jgi:tRNA nucleotidyltransferase (CCA-adding enzyme)
MSKITQIVFSFVVVLILVSCKNTKQKIQEHVSNYNTTSSIKGPSITSTSAKAFLNDNKIEIRIETNLEETDSNKLTYSESFPDLLKEMINNDQISKELIEEGVKFDVYFLTYNNSIIARQLIGKEELAALTGSDGSAAKVTAKL